MKIGTIGAGEVARSFAKKAADAGHDVRISNSRGPDSLSGLSDDMAPLVRAVLREEAAQSDIVLLAVPWPRVPKSLEVLPPWNGRILIDATNGFGENGLVDFGDDSSSEIVQRLAPDAHVVKAMNAMFMPNFAGPPPPEPFRRVLLLSGDHQESAHRVADLFESMGFAPIYLGPLRSGGRMQGVGATLAGHDLHVPWPAPRDFPAFNGASLNKGISAPA